jgi:MFS family permease
MLCYLPLVSNLPFDIWFLDFPPTIAELHQMVNFQMKGKEFKPTKLTLIGLLFASMMMLMGGAAVAPALPMISEVFPNESEFVISLIVTLPSLAIAITGMGMGVLADKYGKVKILLVSLVIFGFAGISGYFSNDVTTILVGRFFVGVGIAGLTCSCTALLSEYYSGAIRVKILGYQAAAMGIGALVLEISGGVLAGISWKDPFLIYGLGFLITMLVLISAKEPTHPEPLKGSDFVPNKRINRKLVIVCYFAIFLTMFLMFALPTKLVYYVMEMGGSTTLSGIFLGLNGVCSAITSVFYRRFSEKFNIFAMLTIAFGLFAAAYLLFALPASYPATFISVCFVGFAVGFVMPTVTNTLAKESTQKTSGKIMGGFTMMFYFGQFLSSLILILIIDVAGSYRGMFEYLGFTAVLIFVIFAAVMIHERSVTIRLAATERTRTGIKKVLIATDGSKNNEAAIEQGITIAKALNAEATVLSVKDLGPYLSGPLPTTETVQAAVSDVTHIADEAVDKVVERYTEAGIIVNGMILSGSAADTIISVSKDYDLIIMGTLGRTGIAHMMIGSVAERVVRSAKCPVMVVRSESSE